MENKKEYELTKAITEEILKLDFGSSPALPWCRESFPELDRLLNEYKKIKDKKKFNLFIKGLMVNDMLKILDYVDFSKPVKVTKLLCTRCNYKWIAVINVDSDIDIECRNCNYMECVIEIKDQLAVKPE